MNNDRGVVTRRFFLLPQGRGPPGWCIINLDNGIDDAKLERVHDERKSASKDASVAMYIHKYAAG